MGRVLTATFDYKECTYTAVVVIRATEDGFAFSVSLPDESLHYLLPDGRFSYNTVNGTETIIVLPDHEPAQELVACIIRTIETLL